MTLEQATQEIVGKKCSFIFTGLQSTGTITAVEENEYVFDIKIDFDQSINWGGQIFNRDTFFMRKCDGWGSAIHIEILN